MHKDLLLAVDVGTQSVRALVFDLEGKLLDKAQIPIEAYVSRQPGWAEQDPELFWLSLCQACQQIWQQGKVKADSIAGLSLSTQRGTVVNVDKEGKPLRDAIIWLDQRRTEGLKPIGGLWALLFRVIGMRETIAYFQAEAEANWLARQQAEIWQKTHKYLLLSGYLHFKLCADYVDSVASQVAYIPFDYKQQRWAKSWDWKWQVLKDLRLEQLPRLYKPAEQLGELCSEAAQALGLPKGLTIIAAAADKACEVLGSGALEPHIACLSYGTTATINTTHKRYYEVIPFIPPYPSAVPGSYSLEVQVYRGYWMVNWFKREFGLHEEQRAAELGLSPETLFDELVRAVPAGSMGLMLQPYWSPGIKKPGPEAKGAVIGFGDVHTRAHLYRAILEGLAYALREGAEAMQQRTGTSITDLRVAGGGSQSNAAMQVTADLFGLSASKPHVYEASGLGAAIISAVGLGLQPDFSTAVRTMTHKGQVFDPDAQTHELYDALYQRVYKQMYSKLKPLYEAIRDITGYPPV